MTDARLDHACHDIADTLLPTTTATTLGDVTLHPHQRIAADRLRALLARHQVALLADDVGTGKTYAALAVAAGYRHIDVIAPASLLPMWRQAIAHAALPHVTLRSVEAFSRACPGNADTGATGEQRLVIIDEAHHVRTPTTRRYRHVARHVAGAHLLLVSATPLHNSTADPRALFGLSLGDRAPANDDDIAALTVRHTTHPHVRVARRGRRAHAPQAAAARPRVRHHPPHRLVMHRPVLDAILALPAPLPAHDGAAAGALIRLGLLRAWCSSDAALAGAIRHRRLRGAALEDALAAGRLPTQAELRSWVVGEFDGQLAFPELLATHAVTSAPLHDVLRGHLDALAALAALHARCAAGPGGTDAQRAAWLRALRTRHAGTPILAFTQFTRTVDALQRALRDIAGVGALTGRSARIASGTISRSDALARFAPRAQERPPPPPHEAITLLLTTDILAEGVNLQDAGVVVHLDLPWTAARRDQRVGRCARSGSRHAVVHVHELAPSPEVESAVAVAERVARKAREAGRLLGDRSRAASSHPMRARAQLDAILAEWRAHATAGHDASTHAPHGRHAPRVLCIEPTRRRADATAGPRAALLLVHTAAGARLLAVRAPRWRVRTAPARVLRLCRALEARRAHHAPVTAAAWPEAMPAAARRAVRAWARNRRARYRAGLASAAGRTRPTTESASVTARATPPPTHAAVRQRLLEIIAQRAAAMSQVERRVLAPAVAAARACALEARGAAALEALLRWCADAPPVGASMAALQRWLDAWRDEAVLAQAAHALLTPAVVRGHDAASRIALAIILMG
ncbi:MAG: DEAD/DEAH box helicase [Gemmatimonadetes bacterium]|nr:DEAD/DEAH box helicase [Gemmatimonadota bacterium]